MLSKHAFFRTWAWWMVTGIGLVSGGCSDTSDSRPARLDDRPLSCTPEVATYRIVEVDPSAHHAVIDLDANGTPDDELGRSYDTIASLEPAFAVPARMPARLTSEIPWLFTIARCGTEARVTIDQGIELDATHVYAPQVVPRAVGTLTSNHLAARDGLARIPLVALADPLSTSLAPGWTDGDSLTIEATLTPATPITDEALTGHFAIALSTDLARRELAPPIAAFLDAQPATDSLRMANDTNHDGRITSTELAASPTYQALIDSDLLVNDTPSTSLAFTFTAIRVP